MLTIRLGLCITSLIFLQLHSGHAQDSCSVNEAARTRLKKTLLCGYDKVLRPVQAETDTVRALIHLYVRYVDLDEVNHAVTLSTWTSLKWKDAFLTWDPRLYDGITTLMLSSKDIWVPDISLLTTGQVSEVPHGLPATQCEVGAGGDVACAPPFTHVARCLATLRQWPFDQQSCTVVFGSWSYVTQLLNTTFEGTGITTAEMKPNSVWELLGASTEIEPLRMWNNESYSRIKFNFELRRHSGAHLATVVIPAFVLSVLTLLTFLLEAGCPERITLGCMNALAHCLYLQYLGMKLPPNGDSVPAIVVFFRDSMFMVGASLVLAVLVRAVARARTEAPAWLATLIGTILSTRPGQIFLLSQLSPMSGAAAGASGDDRDTLVDAEDGGGGAGGGGGDGSADAATAPALTTWQHGARLLDRVGLVVFGVAFFALLVGYVP